MRWFISFVSLGFISTSYCMVNTSGQRSCIVPSHYSTHPPDKPSVCNSPHISIKNVTIEWHLAHRNRLSCVNAKLLLVNSYSFLVWFPLRRYDRPFLSLNSGPTCSKTVAFIIATKSSCCVMQFILSGDIKDTAGTISLQHLCSVIPTNKFVRQ